MKRLVMSSTLGALALLMLVMPAVAGRAWCMRDPIVKLDGVEYQLLVGIPEENVPQVNGPVLFEFYSPKGTQQELIFMDEGFNGYGERIDFKEHDAGFAHNFFVRVPRTGSDFPVLVEVYKNGTLVDSVIGDTQGFTIGMPIVDVALDNQATFKTRLGDVDYEMVITADQTHLSQVNGDLTIEVYSPKGVSQQRIGSDAGFNGYDQRIEFKEHKNRNEHAFFVKAQRSGSDFPLKVELFKDGQLVGTANGDTNGVRISTSSR